MEREERISAMEERLRKARSVLDGADSALDKLEAELDGIVTLADYYGSDIWHSDREADERGELPEGMPRGVLGEDYVYDVIMSRRQLAVRMIELAARILKN